MKIITNKLLKIYYSLFSFLTYLEKSKKKKLLKNLTFIKYLRYLSIVNFATKYKLFFFFSPTRIEIDKHEFLKTLKC